MPDTEAPGLQWRNRANGGRVAYWVAQASLVRLGFRPKTSRLHGDLEEIKARCRILQNQMLGWAHDRKLDTAYYLGTLASLVDCYERDEDSPYRDLKSNTRRAYSKTMAILVSHKGDRQIDKLTGLDVKRWYREYTEASSRGWAYYVISVLKAVLSYGAAKGWKDCLLLRQQLREVRFQQQAPRETYMSYEQVVAFREAAYRLRRPSMAIGVTLQRDLAFRQKDVIGEWTEDETGDAAIRHGKFVWGNGLTVGHIGPDGVLTKQTTKTGKKASHRLADYPDVVEALKPILDAGRIGPLVINEHTRLPYTAEQYRYWFRLIAREAGIPDEVWNMDARAGAVTEAYEAGATTEEAMALAAHTQASTSRRYLRNTVKQSSRAAKLRVQDRTSRE